MTLSDSYPRLHEALINDQPYSNRELDEWKTDISKALQRIEEQTKKTNGRVTLLEKFMWTTLGGIAILAMLIVPIIPKLVNFENEVHFQVQAAIQDALSVEQDSR